MKKQRKLFCERNALFFAISQKKGILLRHLRDLFSREKLHPVGADAHIGPQ